MENDLLSTIGKAVDSAEVRAAIKKYDLTKIKKSPPSRRYFCSEKNGLDLAVDDDIVRAVQIYVQAQKPYKGFSGILPYGILPEMSQKDLHKKLGKPASFSEFESQYERPEIGARLAVEYDDSMKVKFVHIGLPIE